MTATEDTNNSRRLQISLRIGVVEVCMILGIIGGMFSWAFFGYSAVLQKINDQTSQIDLLKQRLTTDEVVFRQQAEDYRAEAARTYGALTKLSDQVGDIRALVAAIPNATRK